MIARSIDPEPSYSRLMHYARAASEAADDLDPIALRRLAAGWSPDRLQRAEDVLAGAALGLSEAAEVLEGLRHRQERKRTHARDGRVLKGGLDRRI